MTMPHICTSYTHVLVLVLAPVPVPKSICRWPEAYFIYVNIWYLPTCSILQGPNHQMLVNLLIQLLFGAKKHDSLPRTKSIDFGV